MIKFKIIITSLLLLIMNNIVVANELELKLNADNSVLSITVSNQQRGFLLKQIAKKMNHALQGLENIEQTEMLSVDISGSVNKVLTQLVSPASVMLATYSANKKLAQGVDGIIWILPVGEEKDPLKEKPVNTQKAKSPFRSKNMSESEWKEFRRQQKNKGKGIAEAERAERLGFGEVDD